MSGGLCISVIMVAGRCEARWATVAGATTIVGDVDEAITVTPPASGGGLVTSAMPEGRMV